MADPITIVDLIRNGTMDADMAALLWAAVDERVSFLTAAQPRKAGKSTTSEAALALRRPEVPRTAVLGAEEEMARLERARIGGYLVIEEISQGRPGIYIWGEPVRRVFKALDAGYSLQASLHAPTVAEAVRIVAEENGVGDGGAAVFGLVLLIERFGEDDDSYWRRLAEVYELTGVAARQPIGRTLFRWHADGDRFEKVAEPQQFARDRADLERRAAALRALAGSGRTSPSDVAAAVAEYHSR